jgi:hypothetical protein
MKRKILSLCVGLGMVLVVGATTASDFAEFYVERIEREGFTVVSINRTLLGRVQIVSEDAQNRRETVLNPLTGELLQDLIIPTDRVPLLPDLEKLFDFGLRQGRHGDSPKN